MKEKLNIEILQKLSCDGRASDELVQCVGQLWPDDSSCLAWKFQPEGLSMPSIHIVPSDGDCNVLRWVCDVNAGGKRVQYRPVRASFTAICLGRCGDSYQLKVIGDVTLFRGDVSVSLAELRTGTCLVMEIDEQGNERWRKE